MKKVKKSYLIKIFAIVAAAVFFTGCGLWNNFTTYFNGYYNTKKAFDQAEKIIHEEKKELFIYKEKAPSQQADKLLNSVIEKGSSILQFDQESAFFDDALFMVGKAFYYQQNYSKALRKFLELEAVANPDFQLENNLWIGKSEIKLRNFDKGMEILNGVIAEAVKEEEKEILRDAYTAQISYRLYRENYEDAIRLMNELINVSDDEKLNARVSYELGKVYLTIEDQANAAEAFASVKNYSPEYEIEFESSLEYAKTLKAMGKNEESLDLFYEMRAEDKYKDHFDAIDLQIAEILYNDGELEAAYDKFTVVDTTYKNSESSGIAKYRRAEMWENDFNSFDSAKYFYDRIRSTSAPNEYKSRSASKLQKLNKYFKIKDERDNYNRQLDYIYNPESFTQDSIAYAEYQQEVADLAQSSPDVPARGQRVASQPNQPGVRSDVPTLPVRPVLSADSLNILLSKTNFELGNFFYTEIIRPDSAFYYYQKVVENEDAPNLPNAIYAMGSYYLSNDNPEKADSIFNYIYDNYQNLDIVNEAARQLGKEEIELDADPAGDAYLIAENKFEEENYTDALLDLKTIYSEYPESPFAAKALYTSGWIYENKLDKPDSAAAVYDSLRANYQNTQYARSISAKLNAYIEANKVVPEPSDSTVPPIQTVRDSIITQPDSLNLNNPDDRMLDEERPPRDEGFRRTKQDTLINSGVPKDTTELITP